VSQGISSPRILVVGASAGIGRAFAKHSIAAGAQVCVAARRRERLVELCDEAGGGHIVTGDVSSAADCRRLVVEAAEHLGEIDVLLYAAGVAAMSPIEAIEPDLWRRDFDVNVIGANLVCAAALPVLSPNGLVAFISSESTAETRWGLASYAASKSALDASIRHWRHEHPERRFQRIVMGATIPTEFGDQFPADVLHLALDRWIASGISMAAMETDDVGRQLSELLAVMWNHPNVDVPDLCLDPRGGPWA